MSSATSDTNHEFESHCQAGAELFAVKNKQYGDNYKVYGLLGVVCQILGATSRLPQLVLWSDDHGKSAKESLVDILTDIHNFANMALIVIDHDNWDGRKG